jgi:hypothetical protein
MAKLAGDDYRVKVIEEIVGSPAGVAAMKAASAKHHPALAGIDRRLSEALGEDYADKEVRSRAGWHVAAQMRALGYKSVGRRRMPPGYIAQSGLCFEG